MNNPKFSYIFDEDIDRVYHCFVDTNLVSDITYKDFLTEFNIEKGNDTVINSNITFSLTWKQYYQIEMMAENNIDEEFCKSFTVRTIKIDKLPTEVSLIYNFYWDSVQKKTLFVLEFSYSDDFFADLFDVEFNEEEKIKVCKNIEKYLGTICKGLEITNSCVINSSLEEVWKNVSNPKLFFSIISKEILVETNEPDLTTDTMIDISMKSKQSNNPVKLLTFGIDKILLTPDFAKLAYSTVKAYSLQKQEFTLTIKKLDGNKCYFCIVLKPTEPINIEIRDKFQKYWKKKIYEFYKFFEPKVK